MTCAGVAAEQLPASQVEGTDIVVFGGGRYAFQSGKEEYAEVLHTQNMITGRRDVLFRGEGRISNLRASPDGRHIAFCEHFWEENVEPSRSNYQARQYDCNGQLVVKYHRENQRLSIMDLKGNVLRRFDQVRRFIWSPDGNRLAFITGRYYVGGLGFASNGTWVYELSSGEAVQIHDSGHDLKWATWDGNLYIYTIHAKPPVLRYTPDDSSLVPTTRHGIHFSPDGSHYYHPSPEGGPFGLYESSDDREVTSEHPFFSQPTYPRGWLDEDTLIIPLPRGGEGMDLLYELSTKRAYRASGWVLGQRGDSGVLVLQKGDLLVQPRSQLIPVSRTED